MDHRGRAYDNIFVERLWRTVKYEDVYPNAYETPRDARIGINNYMNFYNHERPHSRLKNRTHNRDTFKITISTMIVIRHLTVFEAGIDKCNIIS